MLLSIRYSLLPASYSPPVLICKTLARRVNTRPRQHVMFEHTVAARSGKPDFLGRSLNDPKPVRSFVCVYVASVAPDAPIMLTIFAPKKTFPKLRPSDRCGSANVSAKQLVALSSPQAPNFTSTRDLGELLTSFTVSYRAVPQLQQRSRPSRPRYLRQLRSV